MVFIERVDTGLFGEEYSNAIITSRMFYKVILRDKNRVMKGIYGEHEVYREENWDV